MNFIPFPEGENLLRRFRISEQLICVARGEKSHPLLDFRCKGPSFFAEQGAKAPHPDALVALWDCCDSITAFRVHQAGCDFVDFSIEDPQDFRVLASTEQGLWTTVFVDLIEDNPDVDLDQLLPAAEAVGFKFMALTFERYVAASHSTFEQHQAFLDAVVSLIDSQSGMNGG